MQKDLFVDFEVSALTLDGKVLALLLVEFEFRIETVGGIKIFDVELLEALDKGPVENLLVELVLAPSIKRTKLPVRDCFCCFEVVA